jgi:hypothetical protein
MNRLKKPWLWLVVFFMAVGSVFAVRYLVSPYPPSKPGTGVVIGKLDQSSQISPGYNAQDLYLARLLEGSQPDSPPIITFTYSSDPHTVWHDSEGKFAFTDVPSGIYVFIIWNPGVSFVIEPPEGGVIKVTVDADKTTDIGTITLR